MSRITFPTSLFFPTLTGSSCKLATSRCIQLRNDHLCGGLYLKMIVAPFLSGSVLINIVRREICLLWSRSCAWLWSNYKADLPPTIPTLRFKSGFLDRNLPSLVLYTPRNQPPKFLQTAPTHRKGVFIGAPPFYRVAARVAIRPPDVFSVSF